MRSLAISDFRAAAESILATEDVSCPDPELLTKVAETLRPFTRSFDHFLESDSKTKLALRNGGKVIHKRYEDDFKLHSLICQMRGNMRHFREMDKLRRANTVLFLAGVAGMR